jgi:hypothetical protein
MTDLNDYDDTDIHLDTSWLQNEERLQTVQNNLYRESMDSINGIFMYINQNNYIDKIVREKLPLVDCENCLGSQIPYSALLKIIQSKKLSTPVSKYKFSNLYSFIVDLEPDSVQSFSNLNEDNDQITQSTFFKEERIIDNIIVPPSIFVFHDINNLYFFFQEVLTTKHNITLKSILKPKINTDNIEPYKNKHTKTKKVVRIVDKLDAKIERVQRIRKRGTRKRR